MSLRALSRLTWESLEESDFWRKNGTQYIYIYIYIYTLRIQICPRNPGFPLYSYDLVMGFFDHQSYEIRDV